MNGCKGPCQSDIIMSTVQAGVKSILSYIFFMYIISKIFLKQRALASNRARQETFTNQNRGLKLGCLKGIFLQVTRFGKFLTLPCHDNCLA